MAINFNNNQNILEDLYNVAAQEFDDSTPSADQEEPDTLPWTIADRTREIANQVRRQAPRRRAANRLTDLYFSRTPN